MTTLIFFFSIAKALAEVMLTPYYQAAVGETHGGPRVLSSSIQRPLSLI